MIYCSKFALLTSIAAAHGITCTLCIFSFSYFICGVCRNYSASAMHVHKIRCVKCCTLYIIVCCIFIYIVFFCIIILCVSGGLYNFVLLRLSTSCICLLSIVLFPNPNMPPS